MWKSDGKSDFTAARIWSRSKLKIDRPLNQSATRSSLLCWTTKRTEYRRAIEESFRHKSVLGEAEKHFCRELCATEIWMKHHLRSGDRIVLFQHNSSHDSLLGIATETSIIRFLSGKGSTDCERLIADERQNRRDECRVEQRFRNAMDSFSTPKTAANCSSLFC